MGVLDWSNQPSNGYCYVWWAQCQTSGHISARSLEVLTDRTVAACLSSMLSHTGAFGTLLCADSQAEEYGGQVLDVCRQ